MNAQTILSIMHSYVQVNKVKALINLGFLDACEKRSRTYIYTISSFFHTIQLCSNVTDVSVDNEIVKEEGEKR